MIFISLKNFQLELFVVQLLNAKNLMKAFKYWFVIKNIYVFNILIT